MIHGIYDTKIKQTLKGAQLILKQKRNFCLICVVRTLCNALSIRITLQRILSVKIVFAIGRSNRVQYDAFESIILGFSGLTKGKSCAFPHLYSKFYKYRAVDADIDDLGQWVGEVTILVEVAKHINIPNINLSIYYDFF